MPANSSIAWCDDSQNLWIGCTKIDNGCTNCYAAQLYDVRFKKGVWGAKAPRWVMKDPLGDLRRLDRRAAQKRRRRRVFINPDSDFFETHEGSLIDGQRQPVDGTLDDLRAAAFRCFDGLAWLDLLLLTKRPESIGARWTLPLCAICRNDRQFLDRTTGTIIECLVCSQREPELRANCWLGTSAATQAEFDKNATALLANGRGRGSVLFLSLEPMLERIEIDGFGGDGEFRDTLGPRGIDWLIVGCESDGPRVGRLGQIKSESDWIGGAVHVVKQCRAAGVPVFVKQIPIGGRISHDPAAWPAALARREFPRVTGARSQGLGARDAPGLPSP